MTSDHNPAKDVFILGAGFSKAICTEMPLLADLSRMVEARLNKAPPPAVPSGNIELWLTYLAASSPWLDDASNLRNRADYVEISGVIAEEIGRCMMRSGHNLEGQSPLWLKRLLEYWTLNDCAVITLNYDTLVERAALAESRTLENQLREKHIAGPRRLRGDFYGIKLMPARPTVKTEFVRPFLIYKLHGSTNWFYSGSEKFYGENLVFVCAGGCDPAQSGFKTLIEPSAFEKYLTEYTIDKVPLIVPPVIEKTFYFQHESLRKLWYRAHDCLFQAERVFFLGYSLPQSDLTMHCFLRSGMGRDKKRVYVADTKAAVGGHICSLLGCEVEQAFFQGDPVSNLVNELCEGRLG